MDEPTSALDPIATVKVENLISELKEKYTIVIVTHNMQQASRISDFTAFFYMGDLIEFDQTHNLFTNPKIEKQARAWDTYKRIHLHLRKNYFRVRTIEELANELNIDPSYLSRVFKRFHNESPYRFLISLNLGHAASLLLSSRRLIKDIAFELGFENPFHFSRTFKSVYGVAPENFLQKCRY